MRFRVTSIAWEEEANLLSGPMCLIEDWLNAVLSDGDFGGSLRNLMILIITHHPDDGPEDEGHRKISRLSTYKDPFSGKTETVLALHIHLEAPPLHAAGPEKILPILSELIIDRLPVKPLRVPKDLDYSRLKLAVCLSIEAFLRQSTTPAGRANAA